MKSTIKQMQVAATATGDGTAVDCTTPLVAYTTATMQLTGINGDTITWEGTVDGTNYVSLIATNMASAAAAATATADGVYRINCQGILKIRARISTYSAGTIYVTAQLVEGGASSGASGASVSLSAAIPAGTNNIGDVDVLTIAAGTNTIGATRDAGPSWTTVFGVSGAVVSSADASTATAVTGAPTSGQKICIDDIFFSVGATAMQVDFEEETSGTVLITCYCAANTVYQLTPRGKLKLATADKKLMVDTSAAGNISVLVSYHSEA